LIKLAGGRGFEPLLTETESVLFDLLWLLIIFNNL